MDEKSFEEQILDELRKTDNLMFYIAGRRELSNRDAGLEEIQEQLSQNYATINRLYKKLVERENNS